MNEINELLKEFKEKLEKLEWTEQDIEFTLAMVELAYSKGEFHGLLEAKKLLK